MLGIPIQTDAPTPSVSTSSSWGPPRATQEPCKQPQPLTSTAAQCNNPWDTGLAAEGRGEASLSPPQVHLRSLLLAAAQSTATERTHTSGAQPWVSNGGGAFSGFSATHQQFGEDADAAASMHRAPFMHDPPPSLGELPWAMDGSGSSSSKGPDGPWPMGFDDGRVGVPRSDGNILPLPPLHQMTSSGSAQFPMQLGGFGLGHSLGMMGDPPARGIVPPPARGFHGGGSVPNSDFGMPIGPPPFGPPRGVQPAQGYGLTPGGGVTGWRASGQLNGGHDAVAFDVQRQLDQLSLDVARGRTIAPLGGGGSVGPAAAMPRMVAEAAPLVHGSPSSGQEGTTRALPGSGAKPGGGVIAPAAQRPPQAATERSPQPAAADAFRHQAAALARPVDPFTAHILDAISGVAPAPGEEESQVRRSHWWHTHLLVPAFTFLSSFRALCYHDACAGFSDVGLCTLFLYTALFFSRYCAHHFDSIVLG